MIQHRHWSPDSYSFSETWLHVARPVTVLLATVIVVPGCGSESAAPSAPAGERTADSPGRPATGADGSEQPGTTQAVPDAHGVEDQEYTNRLIDSTSPYLLQHAHNPVDWYPWGEEALERAKRENKPISLSVGYSTCYWCHVMEREVFENPEIAVLMNELFINIKVDREQRPDLDEIYMTATQLMTRRGGWPNNVFLTPDLEPFYAGTYFGPTDQGSRPGFPTLLRALSDQWTNQQQEVLATAERAASTIRRVLGERRQTTAPSALSAAVVDRAVAELSQRYDRRLGGFGAAPKFPNDFTYPLLFNVHDRTGDQGTLDMATHTLRMMAAGGIYDHVGGGFHRYSTDAQWRVPHFEKMLYNQAQLVVSYVAAYESTGDPMFADVARGILRCVAEVMTGTDGQFYSALDAETDAVEGAYYVWTRSEVQQLLSGGDLALFDQVFALGNVPTFPGHKHPDGGVLYMRKPITEVTRDLNAPYAGLRAQVDSLLSRMKARRDQRTLPHLDDKVISGWNGMMLGAYADAGMTLAEPSYITAAERAAAFVLERMRRPDGQLLRVWRRGVAGQSAFQEDYSFVIQGLLVLNEATDDVRWLDAAVELTRISDELFWDTAEGGYYFAQDTPDLIARSKSISDGAIPSGNSTMLHCLVQLWQVTGDDIYRQRVEQMLRTFGGTLAASPSSQIHMVHALEEWLRSKKSTSRKPRPPSEITLPGLGSVTGGIPPLDGEQHVTASVLADPTRVRPGETFLVHVDLTVEDGWHINANPASSPLLIPTIADLRGDSPVELVSVTYPEAETLRAAYAEEPIRVLDGQVRITLKVRLDGSAQSGTTVPVRVLIQYQACDDTRCLPHKERIEELTIEAIS